MTTGPHQPQDPRDLPFFLRLVQASEVAQVTPRTLRRWIAQGRLRATRPTKAGSGRVLVKRDSLLELLGEGEA